MKALRLLTTAVFILFLGAGTVLAADREAGKVVALRGGVTISRGQSIIAAKVKSPILSHDTIRTGAAARAKVLFIDDSVLTLGERSQLVVQEFIHQKGKVGSSIYNLLDGKMRSVVGKTRFEVRTPTAVASARGTVIFFDVGMSHNQSFSKIICLEGKVEVRSVLPGVTGTVLLTPGKMVTVKAGEAPPPPAPAPKHELDNARQSTSQSGSSGDSSSASNGNGGNGGSGSSSDSASSSTQGSGNSSGTGSSSGSGATTTVGVPAGPEIVVKTPVINLPPPTPTKVNINITVPR